MSTDSSPGWAAGGACTRSGGVGSAVSLERLLAALVLAALALRLHLIFTYEVNWDEFLHLSKVYAFERGELRRALQSIFVHAFRWIDRVPGSEVDQVVAARLVMYLLAGATAGFLYLIARRFLPAYAALFAVLAYLSFSFVLRQGTSLRTDPIAACLLMAALWVILCRAAKLRNALVAGLLIGLAGAVTIKSAVYVPSIALVLLIALWAAEDRRRAFLYGLITAGTAALGFLGFYLVHRLTLGSAGPGLGMIEGAAGKTLIERDFLNAILTFRLALIHNPVFWLATVLGLAACVGGLIRAGGRERARWATLLALGAILGSLGVYSQSFAYYYPFMLAPAAVLCGAGLSLIPARARRATAGVAGAALGLSLLVHYAAALQQDNSAQRRVLEVVHRAFPEPTPYIDRCSMVSSYPKHGFFMSVWGMQNYYRRGERVMRPILERHQPRFLIANRRMLELDDLGPGEYGPEHFGLFREDLETLKANFVRHWGPIYVAGKRFEVAPARPVPPFEILIAGPYTLESPVPVVLDGRVMRPGEVVELGQGTHRLGLPEGAGKVTRVTLRWGDHLYRPDEPPPQGPLFRGF